MKKTIRSEGGFTPAQVERLRTETAAFLESAAVAKAQAYSIVTVVDEVACNILEHAQASFLELEINTALGLTELLFRDDGTPFDPTERVRAQVALMPGDSPERKLGLYMVASLGEGLRYERRGNLNELRINIAEQAPADGGQLLIRTQPGGLGQAWRVRVAGKLDVFTFAELKKVLEDISAKDPAALLAVDLGQVTYIASSGWSALLARRKLARQGGGNLAICCVGPEIKRVYDAMRIGPLLPLADSLDEACQFLETRG
jgi:anti-anti-sigma factor